ncbi:hypothetical protein HYS48_05345 [Candidatus Woesearchaeota archaeon]|nr:hypothetical protein [Candidatus Woesearchaeota archaeon]
MSIGISKETSKKLENASKVLGLKKEEIIDRAILTYLDNIDKFTELKKELRAWEKLSDEALENFERAL